MDEMPFKRTKIVNCMTIAKVNIILFPTRKKPRKMNAIVLPPNKDIITATGEKNTASSSSFPSILS